MAGDGGQPVDNRPHSVEKLGPILERVMGLCGTLPPDAEMRGLTGSVGSARGPQDKPQGPEPSGSPTYQLENLERLNATSEAELVRALGGRLECRRCGGTGFIPSGWMDDGRHRECPRCNGTGIA